MLKSPESSIAFDKSEGVLREALRLEPDSEQRHLALADYLAGRRTMESAEAVLTDAHRVRFPMPCEYSVRARPPLRAAPARQGQAGLRRRVRPQQGQAGRRDRQGETAALDWADGKHDSAQQLLQEVLHEKSSCPRRLCCCRAASLFTRGDGRDAVQAFRTVLKDQPDQADAYALLGQAHLMLEETSLARENLEKPLR
ncbi:MAG: tetratricopeptide repeat protein [Nitrospiraceae bacterium]